MIECKIVVLSSITGKKIGFNLADETYFYAIKRFML